MSEVKVRVRVAVRNAVSGRPRSSVEESFLVKIVVGVT